MTRHSRSKLFQRMQAVGGRLSSVHTGEVMSQELNSRKEGETDPKNNPDDTICWGLEVTILSLTNIFTGIQDLQRHPSEQLAVQ